MAEFNPFQINETATTIETVLTTPVAENEQVLVIEEPEVTTKVKPPKGFTKDGTPRKARAKNPPIPKEIKAQMISRYANETPNEIAASLGLEPRQVYNVVRNSRILLETALTTETNPAKIALIQEKLLLMPHKESTGVTGGPRINTLSIDDILNMV